MASSGAICTSLAPHYFPPCYPSRLRDGMLRRHRRNFFGGPCLLVGSISGCQCFLRAHPVQLTQCEFIYGAFQLYYLSIHVQVCVAIVPTYKATPATTANLANSGHQVIKGNLLRTSHRKATSIAINPGIRVFSVCTL
jgi:hypothetical protein